MGNAIHISYVFDIHLVIADVSYDEVYSEKTVFKVEIYDKTLNNKLLGSIYMDLFDRKSKYKNDCTFPLRQSSMHSEHAVVGLVCHFTKDSNPVCLQIQEVETLFHEYGHALHSILSKTKFQHISGSRVHMDFMETPSQLMEYFVYSYPVLSLFSRHHQTGEILPYDYFCQMVKWRSSFAAMEIQQDICKAMMDILFHSDFKEGEPLKNTTEIAEMLQNKYTFYSYPKGSVAHGRFDHLIGYGASYYSYLYSKLYASTIWVNCFQSDPLSKESGMKYRRELLERGGSREPDEIMMNLVGDVNLHQNFILSQ